jgi:hypothetical protein
MDLETRVVVLAAICLAVASGRVVTSQAPNPYLTQMPAVERVMREIKGSDSIDTAARQAGVFWQLREVIDYLAQGQGRNQFRLTRDEEALKQRYYVAYFNVWQPVEKALAQDGPRLFKLQGYTVDRDLLVDVLERLGSPALRAEYSRVRGESVARAQAQVRAQQQTARQEQERWKTRDQELTKTPQVQQLKTDPQLARCLAAGRDESQCETSSPGLSLTGAYSMPGGFSIWFYPEYAHITCRDVKADAGYRIEVTNSQVALKLVPSKTVGLGITLPEELMKLVPRSSNPDEWQGQRIVFSLRGDGKLSGSGPITVSGSMTAGNVKREISAQEARNNPNATQERPGLWTVTETRTEGRTSSCTLGLLNPTGPSPVLGSFDAIVNTAFTLAAGGKAPAAEKMPPPGLRVSGAFAGQSGLDLQFYPESAIVSCRDAVVARDYSVTTAGSRVLVNVQNGAAPIQLEYRTDKTLVGSGSVQVNGRMFVGMKDRIENGQVVHHPVFNGIVMRDPVFRPVTETCTLGMLAPRRDGGAH